ncbi:MAG TPA: M56 family metallopeptidase [Vicinamibacterales bacterium]|nr:M56 family metallopeptidase [Vicinamibacterales bacterium]
MIAQLTNHLWQSTVFALVAALLALALRRNGAHVRYWVWLAASIKFLVPFALLIAAGALVPWRPASSVTSASEPPAFAVAVGQFARPFPDLPASSMRPARRRVDWMPIGFGVWFSGFAVIALVRIRGWRRIRRAVRFSVSMTEVASQPIEMRSSSGLLEPGVVGLSHPVLLLPAGIVERLTPEQLEAVVAHERCHVRRRDNLTAALHMFVEAVFWFHPLVWWIGARLVAERERACDEAVLSEGLQPRDYADAILNVCKLYVESPLACVSGVTGSNIEKRLDDIMIKRTGIGLTILRKGVLSLAATGALVSPVAIGVMTAPLRAQTTSASAKSATSPETFEVASVRPCDPQEPRPGGRGGRSGGPGLSPGRLYIACMSVEQLINVAYITNGERLLNDDPGYVQWPADGGEGMFVRPTERIRGGPDWAHADKYTIEAKADGTPDRKVMNGPMLRALLEDRFQLKIHRDVDPDVAMFALTVAKGGPKIKPWGAQDECTEWDRATQKPPPMKDVIDMIRRGEKPPCGLGVMAGTNGANLTFALNGVPMDGVAYWLSSAVGRHVLDKTGLPGRFTLYLEYAPEGSTADPAGPSIFTAVQEQWGLKLEPAKGPRGFIVIDHVERPSAGGQSASSAVETRGLGSRRSPA